MESRPQPFAFANPTYLDRSLLPLGSDNFLFQFPESPFQVWIHRPLFGFSLRAVLLKGPQTRIELFCFERAPLTVQHARDRLTLLCT
jgi:hypothetical protein